MAANALSGALKPISSFEIAKIPVGQAAVLSVGMGVGDVIKAVAAQFAPANGGMSQMFAGLATAWALNNLKMVRDLIGADLARLVSLAIVADTINDQVNLQANTANFIAGLTGGRVVSQSPPVWRQRALRSGNSNSGMTGANRGTVQGMASSGMYRGVV